MREIKPDCRTCAHFQRHYVKKDAAFDSHEANANERKRLPWIEYPRKRKIGGGK